MQAESAVSNVKNIETQTRTRDDLATDLQLLQHFANLRDEDAEKFGVNHPGFLLLPQLKESGWKLGVESRLNNPRAEERANEIAEEQPNPVLRLREVLRRIWRGDEHANDYLKLLLYSSRPSADRIEFDWRRGEIVYEPKNDLERIVYTLFKKSRYAKACENPDCPAQYFIAERRTCRYCSAKCAGTFQRESKRKWWNQVGSDRRREKRDLSKRGKKGGKR